MLNFISQDKSGVPLVAQEKFSEPKEVEVLFNAQVVVSLMHIAQTRSAL